jgi:YesN/AraC family two-component response regulator
MIRAATTLILALILSITATTANGQGNPFLMPPDNDISTQYRHLSAQQLLDTANFFYFQNNIDKALLCLDLLINMTPQSFDIEHQRILMEAFHRSATIYYHMDNYRVAYELLLKALQLSEAIEDTPFRARIFIVIGNIYNRLGKQDLAKEYFTYALDFTDDRARIALILNNLGYAYIAGGDLRDAYHVLSQSMQIAREHNPDILHIVLHSLAAYYQKINNFDSAYHYFHLSINEAKMRGSNQHQKSIALSLSDLGRLFLEVNKPDSAIFYINLSNSVASENDFLGVLMDNYLILSQIAESKGNKEKELEYFKHYSAFKDSILNHGKITEINQMQRSREIQKASQHIEQLTIEQQVKNRTIRYQRIIQYISWAVLLLIGAVLTFVITQNKKLNTAYKKLFEKSVEAMESQNEQSGKFVLADETQNELLTRIYALLEDATVICDTELSLEKFADLMQSNRTYISQVINDVLNKNFRTLVNEYRIREAQRLFSEIDVSNYTLEFIAQKTGFKNRNTFTIVFKEVTGVSPSFYLKSMKNQ